MTGPHPRLPGALPMVHIGDGAVAWPDGSPLVIGAATALVLPYLDGATPVDDLIEDASFALGRAEGEVAPSVWEELRVLQAAGAVQGVGPARSDHATGTTSGAIASIDGAVEIERHESAHGTTVTERLADGRYRRTVTADLRSASTTDDLRDAMVTNALTDIVTADTCVGFKLRADEPSHDLLVDLGGETTRVRVDDPDTHDLLRTSLGARVRDDRRFASLAELDDPAARDGIGVTAYVVAPLDGVGPPRVYDRWGERVGRPRDTGDTVAIVGHLLAEQQPVPATSGVLVHAFPILVPDGCVLVSDIFRTAPRLHRQVRRLGWDVSEARRAIVRRDGWVEIEAPWPATDGIELPLRGIAVAATEPPVSDRATATASFLDSMVARGPAGAQEALNVLATVFEAVPAVAIDPGDHGRLAERIAALIELPNRP